MLPYFEIKVVPGQPPEGRVRGTPEEARRLLGTFRAGLKNTPRPDRLLFQITINCELDQSISDDEEFWPRIVLLPGDHLLLRGRNPEEVMRFFRVFTQLVTSDYTVPAAWSSNQDSEIKGGPPHLVALKFNPQAVRRVAAKAAYGLFRTITGRSLEPEYDLYLRRYILGHVESADEPVFIEPMILTTTTSEKPHYVILSPPDDGQASIVSFYG